MVYTTISIRSRLLLIFLLTIAGSISAQEKLDSLESVLENDITPREQILTHNRIARIHINRDTTQALYHRDKMDSISMMHNDTLGKFLVAVMSHIHYFSLGNYKMSESLLYEQLVLAEMMKRDDFITGINYELSLVKRNLDQLDSAVYYANRCYRLIEENPKVPLLNKVMTLNHLGSLSQQAYHYEEALTYYFKADSLSHDVDLYQISNHKGAINLSIGGVYLKLKDTLSAKRYYKRGLTQYKILDNYIGQSSAYQKLGTIAHFDTQDSTLYMYTKASEMAEQVGNAGLMGSAQSSIGDYWLERGETDKALDYYNKAYSKYEEIDRKSSLATTAMRMAKLEEKRGNYYRALQLVKDASLYYNSTGDLSGLHAINYSQGTLLESLGRHKEAVPLILKAYDLKDSMNNAIYNKDVKELQLKYETSLKDQEILKQNIQLKEEKSQRKNLWILSGLLLVIGILVFVFMRNRILYNKDLSEKKSQLQSQKINQLEREKKILSMNAMIEGQEVERTRIAKDLHDGLGGLLSTVKAHFSNIQSEIRKIDKMNVYHKANELVDEACDEVRRISHNLMPVALRLDGLPLAVEHLGEEMEAAHPFSVSVEVIEFKTRMEESQEVFVYRIIQEALNNIIKHADANKVLIQLSETSEEYNFIVEDDGIGYDPLHIEAGLGLKSMQSRVDFLKGSLDVDTREGVGTTLSFHIPKK